MPAYTLPGITKLVQTNNRSAFVSDAFLMCLMWKECGFRPRKNEKGSSARGLMQMTTAAIKDVNMSLGHARHLRLPT